MSAKLAETLNDLLPLLAILTLSGLVAGFVAGLLGVGGGIVTVPVLEYSLRFVGVPEDYRMHVAVATSLAAIIPTAISSSRSHHARGAVDWDLARRWAAPMVLAALAGSLLASHAPMAVLAGVFGSVALLIAAKMLLPLDHLRLADQVPRGIGGGALATFIGGVSAVMGIGGGTLAVPALNLCGYSMHRAVGTASFFGLLISVPGTVGYLLARPETGLPWATVGYVSVAGLAVIGPGAMTVGYLLARPETGLPWATVGYVSVAGLAVIGPGAMLTATLGARTAHWLSRRRLAQAFGVFLIFVGTRMVYRAVS